MADINERKSVITLLRTYRSLPALWDINHEDYNDTFMKQQQYDILLEKYKETNPNGYMEELKRKINTLRTNYWREVRHLRNMALNGRPKVSTLYYFKELSFLNKIKKDLKYGKEKAKNTSSNEKLTMSPSTGNFVKTQSSMSQVVDSCNQILPNTDIEILPNNNVENGEIEIKPDYDFLSEEFIVSDPIPSKIEYETKAVEIKQEINQQPYSNNTCNQGLPSIKSQRTEVEDDSIHLRVKNYKQKPDTYHLLCTLWSQKLERMDSSQRIFAEKLINDVLYDGELGILNFNTTIINLSPYESVPTAKDSIKN